MDIDSYISENIALRRKLESKAEALLILSQELKNCQKERDELRSISQNKNASIKDYSFPERQDYIDSDSFEALKEKNKALFIEIKDLRQKLQEAYSDLKVLRSERNSSRNVGIYKPSSQFKEEHVQEVEEYKAQLRELRHDLQALLDEKEELITERDAYRCKVHRLNHQLTNLLKSSSPIDIDSLVMENKYTKDRLDQALTEVEMARQTLSKYKVNQEKLEKLQEKIIHDDSAVCFQRSRYFGMLDKKKLKGPMKFGNGDEPDCRVVTHKQVLELLEKKESLWYRSMLNKEATISDFHGLCMALLDAIQDKSVSLAHQKKAKRILAERVKYLEERLSRHESLHPSEVLLEGYSTSEVDNLPPIRPEDKNNKDLLRNGLKEDSDDPCRENISDSTASDSERLPKELEELVNQALREYQINSSDK